MGVDASRLEHVRLDVEPLGDLRLAGFAGVVVGGSSYNVTTPDANQRPVQRRVEADLARLPADAVLPASSAACPVQVYRVGGRVWATKFHPERDRADGGKPVIRSMHGVPVRWCGSGSA